MRIFGPSVYELREHAEQDERTRRTAELEEEITVMRRKLLRAIQEQVALARRESANDFEAGWLRGERERLEIALGNLEREHRELMATC